MLNYNEVKERGFIVIDGDPYEVLESQVSRKQQRKPVNQTKLRNLITGGTRQHTFHYADTVVEAYIEKKTVKYAFNKFNRQTGTTEYWFTDPKDKGKRFEVDESVLAEKIMYMKEDTEYEALYFGERIIGVALPIKVELRVIEAPPSIKGNTASGADKKVKVETGAMVTTPVFVEVGDVIKVNTETGQYTERV
jgi:elongation factor P